MGKIYVISILVSYWLKTYSVASSTYLDLEIALPIIAISFCNISWLVWVLRLALDYYSAQWSMFGLSKYNCQALERGPFVLKAFLTLLLRGNLILQCWRRISPACWKVHGRLMKFTFASRLFSAWMILRMRAYSARTPNTWMMQDTTQVSTAVRPSALGALAVTELKMLTRTRNRVTRRAMRPDKNNISLHFYRLFYWLQWHDVVMH